MTEGFASLLTRIHTEKQSNIALLLRPLKSEMPTPMHYYDDPFFPFSKAIISATRNIVCAYVFDFPAYMAHGAAGAIALERSIAYAGSDVLKILHGSFVGEGYISMIYENALDADAATIVHEADYDIYTAESHHGAFVINYGSVTTSTHPTYWINDGCITHPSTSNLQIAGESVLYAGYGDDHAEVCRNALLKLNN